MVKLGCRRAGIVQPAAWMARRCHVTLADHQPAPRPPRLAPCRVEFDSTGGEEDRAAGRPNLVAAVKAGGGACSAVRSMHAVQRFPSARIACTGIPCPVEPSAPSQPHCALPPSLPYRPC